MRRLVLFTLITLFLAHLSVAWQLPQFIAKFTATSRIPQFILDTHHPWLDENRGYLEHLDDPKHALCSLDSKLRPGNGNDTRTYPTDLFRHLEIHNNRVEISRPGWKNAVLRLEEMLVCPAATRDVEDFEVHIHIADAPPERGFLWRHLPPAELPALFAQVLKSCRSLQRLKWYTPELGNQEFQHAFLDNNLTLSSVRHLVLEGKSDFLVAICPSLEILEGDARLALVKSVRTAKHLTKLVMAGGPWKLELLEALLQASPNITTLTMGGVLEDPYQYTPWDGEVHDQLLSGYVEILSCFAHLESLCLPPSWDLGLGYDGGAWCGNAYFGADGRAYGRQDSRKDAETIELAADIVLSKLPELKSLCFGGTHANITRDEYGELRVTWPWTGRITEWTYEIWPEPDEGFDDMGWEF